tara:strand:+ start:726 stop:1013 length:288 start_codon:yes stop_codon:yes gene_type:complete
LNTVKEKKLNAIKSEISEITEFVNSNKQNEVSKILEDKKVEIDGNDTYTLTNIVNNQQNVRTNDELSEIKNELYALKSILTNQELVLKEILLKIK